MTSGTPNSRRALRMYVKISGPLMARGGYTRRVDHLSGFVACEPVFSAGDDVEMELMLNPRTSAGLKVEAGIVSVQSEPGRTPGVELRWRVASTTKSPAALGRFLSKVLGVEEPTIVDSGDGPYRYRHAFPDRGAAQMVSALTAMKSRPMGRQPRRRVMSTDPNFGPAKPTDVIGALSDPLGVAPAPVARPLEEAEAPNDTVPDLTDDIVEDEVVFDEPVSYQVDDGIPEPVLPPRGARPDERRLRPRIAASVPVSFFVHSRGTVGRAHNVSRAGLYIETSEPPPKVGSRVNVRFPVRHGGGNHVVLLTCEVTRHRGPREKPGTRHGFAVCYLVVDELGRTGLFSHFINQHL
ncbi:MAG: PilZ domain-containing protein [Myxococcota bacterium]|nr:PilZ domain-containing protein [Myxococcota bacterium]